MQRIIRFSSQVKRNYKEITDLCKETHSPVFLTKDRTIYLVAMDIETFDARQRSLELRDKLVDIAERRLAGRPDFNSHAVIDELKTGLNKYLVMLSQKSNYQAFMYSASALNPNPVSFFNYHTTIYWLVSQSTAVH